MSLPREIAALREANQSAVPWFEAFAGHREHLTKLVVERATPVAGQRLCLLGAGNCYDLDLAPIAALFREIHLVDLDAEALESARERQEPKVRDQLVLHAPVDLSGLVDKLERWGRFEITEEELVAYPGGTADELRARLGGPFDRVLSACLITQMQVAVLGAFGEQHRLFDAVRHSLTLAHLLTLSRLTAPSGQALLVTDVLANEAYRWLDRVPPDANFLSLLNDVVAADRVMYVARPGLFHLMAAQDPALSKEVELSAPVAAWLWQNGPKTRFLVYAMELRRKLR